ncbi:DNA repair protein RecO [Corynebacterium sp. TAE3-ERU16]|uniref:DNA repair protein RecO n=1 Tax=Corynebacterium sp. TAE3-ERU16 TaxID=2849493 RepID=UPI001C45B718|nr:DNA repair protein RecO [Corynebacterium sp. TAE3-ERU16]MBV7292205.1 DNA repair protein RecO [Corynebacterium sp. TAE3-ERU16]
MRAPSFRDRALVVRTHDFGEADRVVVLLTRGHGLVRSVAKGVRRTRSRFGSRLQPFVELDVQLYPGRNLHSITGADTVAYHGSGIIEDYTRYTCACAVLESAERLAVAEFGDDPWLFDASAAALARLRTVVDPTTELDSFLLRAMGHAGWAPSLFDCAQCGRPGPHHAFHPAAGGAVCGTCRPPGAATPDEAVLRLMWWLAHESWAAVEDARAASENAGDGMFTDFAGQAHQLVRAHLQWHLEHRVRSLDLLDQG